jgi:hypothetical protein
MITIVLSYQYNAEGFAAVDKTAPKAAPKAGSAGSGSAGSGSGSAGSGSAGSGSAGSGSAGSGSAAVALDSATGTTIGSGSGSGSGSGATSLDTTSDAVAITPGAGKSDIYKSSHRLGLLPKGVSSQALKENNIDSILKKDKMNVKSEYRGNFLRLFAQMPSLADIESQRFWLISDNPEDPPIWKRVFVTNDSAYESAAIPQSSYEPYIGQTLYLVPRGSTNPDDAYGAFVVPNPSKPTVVNPKVSVSDTGYDAMKLNKQSNLLNDIQKIIHNEMLSNRSLDVIVKNPNSRTATGATAATGVTGVTGSMSGQLPPKIQAKALAKMKNNSCNSSCSDSSTSCQSDDVPDMSKYIRKDQIPCYGCSLDY